MAHGNVHWSELISADVEGSKKFFTEICGWTINAMPMPMGEYNVAMVGETPVAGIMGVDQIQNANHEITPHWMTYLEVEDVDAAAAKIVGAGGQVINEPFDVPQVGRICIVMDPGKAVVGIMTPASS
jgi:predicted enzyme related to lactoylglutathione lyase